MSFCPTRKRSYDSMLQANQKILWLWKHHRKDSNKYEKRSYPCPHCGKWHLTSLKHYD